MPEKRSASDGAVVPFKKPRTDVAAYGGANQDAAGPPRSSSLLAPIMLLTGHQGEIFCGNFHPDGTFLASAGFERDIYFWNVYGECDNFAVLTGHTGAVLDLKFSTDGRGVVSDKAAWQTFMHPLLSSATSKCLTPFLVDLITLKHGSYNRLSRKVRTVIRFFQAEGLSAAEAHTRITRVYGVNFMSDGEMCEWYRKFKDGLLFTASTDKTLSIWDTEVGVRVKKLKGHTSYVNSCNPARRGPQLICSASDDCTIKVWDARKRGTLHSFQDTYQVTAVTFNDTAEQIISAGIDNVIKVWDMRKNGVLYKMIGHSDTITGLALSPDGSYILSNSMDNTMKIWDIRPFAPQERCIKIIQGHQHNFEKNLLKCSWSPDGSKVTGGSADRFVYVWETTNRRILYKLPGHNGSVNEVNFHPKEPIIMSCSSDKQIYLGEIE